MHRESIVEQHRNNTPIAIFHFLLQVAAEAAAAALESTLATYSTTSTTATTMALAALLV